MMEKDLKIGVSIATIPDINMGRALYRLGDLDDEGVVKAIRHLQKQQTGHHAFPLHLEQIISIAVCYYQAGEWHSLTFSARHEQKLLSDFSKFLQANVSALYSWKGNQYVFPVLHYRLLKYRLPSINNYLCQDLTASISPYAESPRLELHDVCCLFGMDCGQAMTSDAIWQAYQDEEMDSVTYELSLFAERVMTIAQYIGLVT